MKNFLFIFLFLSILLPLNCFQQEILLSVNGNIDTETRLSETFQIYITEPEILRVRIEAPGLSPVFTYYPDGDRGYEWDGEKDGILIYSSVFYGPEDYDVYIRASDWVQITSPEFTMTITIVEPEIISLNKSVSGSYMEDGDNETYGIVKWYEIETSETGNYSVLFTGYPGTYISIENGKEYYTRFWFPHDYADKIPALKIIEPGIYAIKIEFENRTDGEYSLSVVKN